MAAYVTLTNAPPCIPKPRSPVVVIQDSDAPLPKSANIKGSGILGARDHLFLDQCF